MYLEKSSMIVRTYLDPFMDVIFMGPLISECISPKMHDARLAFPQSNLSFRVLSNNTTLTNSSGSFDDQEGFNHTIIL